MKKIILSLLLVGMTQISLAKDNINKNYLDSELNIQNMSVVEKFEQGKKFKKEKLFNYLTFLAKQKKPIEESFIENSVGYSFMILYDQSYSEDELKLLNEKLKKIFSNSKEKNHFNSTMNLQTTFEMLLEEQYVNFSNPTDKEQLVKFITKNSSQSSPEKIEATIKGIEEFQNKIENILETCKTKPAICS